MTVTSGHRRLGVGEDQLGAAPDDPVPLLVGARQEARHVDERQDREAERVAGPHEPGGLLGGVDVQRAGHVQRLVGDHAHRVPLDVPEPDQHVLRVQRLDLEQLAVVQHVLDHGAHVVGLVVRVRHQGVQLEVRLGDLQGLGPLDVLGPHRRVGEVVARQVAQQGPHVVDRVVLVRAQVVRDARAGVVGLAAAELLEPDVLAGHRADHVGTRDEHVRRAVGHHDEVRQSGGVDRAARARPEDQRDLRDDAGRRDVAPEDLGELGQRRDALLDPRAAAVQDPDHRHAGAQRQVHHLGDLLPVHLAQRPAEHREVLAVDRDRAAVDRAVPADHAVAGHPLGAQAEVGRAVLGQRVELGEAALVEQRVDALAGGLLAARVLLGRRGLLGSRQPGGALLEIGEASGGGRGLERPARPGRRRSAGRSLEAE